MRANRTRLISQAVAATVFAFAPLAVSAQSGICSQPGVTCIPATYDAWKYRAMWYDNIVSGQYAVSPRGYYVSTTLQTRLLATLKQAFK